VPERIYWTLGAFAFTFAAGGLYSGNRAVFIVAGAVTVFLFWGGWRFGKRP
jgi:lipopolysaccharide export LptBFGC system permease protein LptF